MVKISRCLAVVALFAIGCPAAASATALNINFGTYPGPGQGPLDAIYGAAAGQAGDWNQINASGTIDLTDLSGNPLPGVTLTLSSVSFGYVGGASYTYSTYDRRLMQGNFYTGSGWEVTLAGLDDGLYNLYVYGPANEAVPSSAFLVNGIAQTDLAHTSFPVSSPLVEGTDYDIISVQVTGNTIDIHSGSNPGASFSGLAGLQLVPVVQTPLPATFLLFGGGLGAMLLLTARRRKRGSTK